MGSTYIYAENYHNYACEPAKTPVCIMKVTFWDQVTSSFCPDWGFWSFAAVVKALGFGCYNPTVLEVAEFSIVIVHTILHTASSCIMLYCILSYHIPVWTHGSINFGGGLWSNFLVCLFDLPVPDVVAHVNLPHGTLLVLQRPFIEGPNLNRSCPSKQWASAYLKSTKILQVSISKKNQRNTYIFLKMSVQIIQNQQHPSRLLLNPTSWIQARWIRSRQLANVDLEGTYSQSLRESLQKSYSPALSSFPMQFLGYVLTCPNIQPFIISQTFQKKKLK